MNLGDWGDSSGISIVSKERAREKVKISSFIDNTFGIPIGRHDSATARDITQFCWEAKVSYLLHLSSQHLWELVHEFQENRDALPVGTYCNRNSHFIFNWHTMAANNIICILVENQANTDLETILWDLYLDTQCFCPYKQEQMKQTIFCD